MDYNTAMKWIAEWNNIDQSYKHVKQKQADRASLVAQWLRIHLPMQETRVQALVWEDPTCRGATKPLHHNYWSPHALVPLLCNKRSHRSEKPVHRNEE